jgi:hypothetical protein
MKRLILILIMVMLACTFLSADIYVRNMKRTEAFEMMGKKNPEKIEIEEQWLGKNKFAQINKEFSIIVDFEKEQFIFAAHKPKQYYRFSTAVDRETLKKMLPAKAFEIITSIKLSGARVTLGGPGRKVANWNCTASEFEMSFMIPALNMMPKMKIKTWTTEEVPFDYQAYNDGMAEFFKNIVLKIIDVEESSRKELEKLDKVKGFQVAGTVVLSLFGSEMRAETQCLEAAEKPSPAGIYSAPSGYAEQTVTLPQENK